METEKKTSNTAPVYKRRWFKISTGLLIAFLLILVLLPRGISYGIRKTLLENGAEQVNIENVDFNPFTGSMKIEGLEILRANRPLLKLHSLTARVDWIPFVSKRILVTDLEMDDVNLVSRTLEDGKIRIAGFLLPTKATNSSTAANEKPWGFGLDSIHLTNLHFTHHYPGQDYLLDVKGIDLRNLKSWEPGKAGTFQFNALLNKAPVNLEISLQPFTDEIKVDGKLRVEKLKLDDFAHFIKQQITHLSGSLNLNQTFSLRIKPGEYVHLAQKGSIGLDNLSLVTTDVGIQQQAFNWEGETKLQQNLKTHAPTVTLEGKLSQQGLALILPKEDIRLKQESFAWQGKAHAEQDVVASLLFEGEVQSKALAVDRGKANLFTSSQLDVHKIGIKGLDQISIASIELLKPSALIETSDKKAKNTPVFIADKITLDTLQVQQQKNIAITSITAHNTNTALTRLQDKKLAVVSLIAQPEKTKTTTPQKTPAPAADKKAEAGTLRIGKINFTGKNQFSFTDYSVTPTFSRTLDISKLALSNLDSSKPEQESPLLLAGKIGKYATLDFKGYLKPFTKKPGLKLVGKLANIDLPPLSSYSARALGYNLSSGTLYAEVDVTITNGVIDGKNKLRLNQLQVKPTDSDKIKALTSQLSMPLDAALSMLRDKNNIIELNLPVTGDINDPQFNLSDIINTALGNVMKTAAMSYLTQMLQPYGSLITLVKLAKKASNAISLEPVTFDPNASVLSTTSKDYLAKIAKLMSDRPNINVRVCGIATKQDRDTLFGLEMEKLRNKAAKQGDNPNKVKPVVIPDDALLALARSRADNIKDWLVTQHKITADRLFTCNPEIDKDEKAKPRANLGI